MSRNFICLQKLIVCLLFTACVELPPSVSKEIIGELSGELRATSPDQSQTLEPFNKAYLAPTDQSRFRVIDSASASLDYHVIFIKTESQFRAELYPDFTNLNRILSKIQTSLTALEGNELDVGLEVQLPIRIRYSTDAESWQETDAVGTLTIVALERQDTIEETYQPGCGNTEIRIEASNPFLTAEVELNETIEGYSIELQGTFTYHLRRHTKDFCS